MTALPLSDPFVAPIIEAAGACLEREAAELAAVLAQLRSLGAEIDWRSSAARHFHVRAEALADDVARLVGRAEDAAAVASATRHRLIPSGGWAF